MKAKSGLQKFTEMESKFTHLMKKKRIEYSDLKEVLSPQEIELFSTFLTKRLNELKGEERVKLFEQISGIISSDTKNQLWESNHCEITKAISDFILHYGKMPTKNQIAAETGLSRQTIHKHLKDYSTHPIYAEEMQKFRFMADSVLSKVYKMAVSGDSDNVRAARLYFEVVGCLGGHNAMNTTINTQNNYIQINQTKFTQETIKQLSAEQVSQIEDILKHALPILSSIDHI